MKVGLDKQTNLKHTHAHAHAHTRTERKPRQWVQSLYKEPENEQDWRRVSV